MSPKRSMFKDFLTNLPMWGFYNDESETITAFCFVYFSQRKYFGLIEHLFAKQEKPGLKLSDI